MKIMPYLLLCKKIVENFKAIEMKVGKLSGQTIGDTEYTKWENNWAWFFPHHPINGEQDGFSFNIALLEALPGGDRQKW